MSAVPLHTPPRAVSPEPPPLRLVPSLPRRRRLAFVVLLSTLATAAVFVTVAINALAAGDAVAALHAERAVEEAEGRYTELVARVARLEDPARIRRVATEELGMVPARGAKFLVLERAPSEEHATDGERAGAGMQGDPLKPVLSVQR
ncbi:MAG: hypothetical protein ABR592_12985 [Nitriliruptorales bacterium]